MENQEGKIIPQASHSVTASCIHKDICSGCPWMDLSANQQKQQKIQALRESLQKNQISFLGQVLYELPGASHLRDRVDLTYSRGAYGFYQKDSRDIFQVTECPQMSVSLFALYEQVRRISLPIAKGSLRLRVAGTEKGLWLDFANEDVKALFEEKQTLHQLMKLGHIEVGQKRKALKFDESENRFRLIEPVYHTWSQTWQSNQVFPLKSLVGSFTQTGETANRVLIRTIEMFLQKTTAHSWVEFGCGNGNLTIPLAGQSRLVTAVEFDESSLDGFTLTLQNYPELKKRISLRSGDFQKKETLEFETAEGILVNPPRSGLGNFLSPLKSLKKKPRDLIYMSCFLDSFSQDGILIQALGYELRELVIVDQFPQTAHFEIVSRWQLSTPP